MRADVCPWAGFLGRLGLLGQVGRNAAVEKGELRPPQEALRDVSQPLAVGSRVPARPANCKLCSCNVRADIL